MERLFRDIRTLVDIPSVSGEEGEVGRYLEKDLGERGFSVTMMKFS